MSFLFLLDFSTAPGAKVFIYSTDHIVLSSARDLEPLYLQNQLYIIHAAKQKNSKILMINQDIKDDATSTKAILIMKLFATTKKVEIFSDLEKSGFYSSETC